jgi:hypothetical protein
MSAAKRRPTIFGCRVSKNENRHHGAAADPLRSLSAIHKKPPKVSLLQILRESVAVCQLMEPMLGGRSPRLATGIVTDIIRSKPKIERI